MRTLYLIFIFLAFFSNIYGQSYDLKVKLKNGNTTNISIDEITKITFRDITSVKVEDLEKLNTAKSSFLLQNYPNPFNPNTTIQYQLPNSGRVEIKVFDMNSKCIKTLFIGLQSEGTQNVSWDSKDDENKRVASGVYLCQIKFNNQIINKKMLLIK